ncbi:prohibitin family protein [Rhabdochromatium marinum]|uniref:prohibitin family protein n=1 Tax=Rhabdochromatium marinum TaxID=48729 RepID=UPI0019040065|nr:prohibitin family protein [Rhabdochromatium marinum]MBK1649050.1 hypothetical protein [Rhabdochromatium marinum]
MKLTSLFKQHQVKLVSVLFATIFLVAYLAPSIFVYIYPGQAGLLFRALADEHLSEQTFHEGLYVVAPWNKMYIYDVTKQKHIVKMEALTNNGLFVKLDVDAIFHPDPGRLKELATHIGADYADKVLIPVVQSSVRQVIGGYTPEELYTTARDSLHAAILTATQQAIAGLPFLIEDIIIERLELPQTINAAIEKKLRLQQDALSYQYLLAKQADESKRLKIEAEGIDEYQRIVADNLTPELLQWLQIRALHELAQSDNSKIIVIGDSDTLPLVLDGAAGR